MMILKSTHIIGIFRKNVYAVPLFVPLSPRQPRRQHHPATPTAGAARRQEHHVQTQARHDVSADDADVTRRYRNHVGHRQLQRCVGVRSVRRPSAGEMG